MGFRIGVVHPTPAGSPPRPANELPSNFPMRRKFPWLLVCATLLLRAAVPTPREHLGFTPGDDYKLADTSQIYGYFQKLAGASDRIRLIEFGKSALGKPM